MFEEAKDKWLCVNLFYNEPWELFLTKAVKPYIDTILSMGIAEQFHFLRFWERGPHIRLCIKGEATVLDNIVLANLIEHFQNFFESKPSNRSDPNYPPNFPDEYKWFPNNSIQQTDYVIQAERFGGAPGIIIAEKQFKISSEIILKNLKEKGEEWSYDEALGLAIKLHLSFVHTMGMTIEKAIQFFEMLFKNWLPRAFRFQNRGYNTTIYLHQEKKTLHKFKDAFELQKDTLIPFHSALWRGLGKAGDFEDQDLNNWVGAHEKIHHDFQLAHELNQLKNNSAAVSLRLPPNIAKSEKQLWPIYSDFVHFTNNRLGISNKDEGFIAYLMMRSLQVVKGQLIPNAKIATKDPYEEGKVSSN